MIAVVQELRLAPKQRDKLVRVLRSNRARRPKAVVARLLWFEGEIVHLVALWESRDALDRYLATAKVPPEMEILATLGAHMPPRIVEVAEYG